MQTRRDALSVALEALGGRGRANAPLGALTTYRVGGNAAVAADVATMDDIAAVSAAIQLSGLEVLIVGRGSNLLVADDGWPGIAVFVTSPPSRMAAADPAGAALHALTVDDEGWIEAGGGVALPTVARRAARAGMRGLEWTVGVPGSVGGAVRMNAGGHGADMAACVISARVVDLYLPSIDSDAPQTSVIDATGLDYGYRRSSIGAAQLVVSARLRASRGDAQASQREIREIVAWRRKHQPGGQNAGSVFVNPPGDSAGRLIDAAGQKGRRWASAVVSAKHANFIQADPGGSADDVLTLVNKVRDAVAERMGVLLEPEVRAVGFPPRPAAARPHPQRYPQQEV